MSRVGNNCHYDSAGLGSSGRAPRWLFVKLVGFFVAVLRVLWRVFGMAYQPGEQICPKCAGKNFRNGICMHCGYNQNDDNSVTKFLEPIGWLIDHHPIVFWSLIIGAAAAMIYAKLTGAVDAIR